MGDKVICYSIGCPQCTVLERQLQKKNIEFELVSDKEVMKAKGFLSAPKLEVNGVVMNFKDAMAWIKEQ